MKATIGETTYTKIKVTFAPQTDLVGDKLPINEVQVQIHTTDAISIGVYLYLYDDLNVLWAKYWITYAEHHDAQTLTVRASAATWILERDMLDPVMYTNEPLEDVLDLIFGQLGSGAYTLHEDFDGVTITGFCPEQSARNRLQWVTLVIGAYVKSYFSETIDILPLRNAAEESGNEQEEEESAVTLIPLEKTFWKPKITFSDYVTRVRAYAYSFTEGTPQTTDAWVTDGTTTWVVSRRSVSLGNPSAPPSAPTHEITIDGLYLINDDNVDSVLAHLSTYYFNRTTIDADVVNNGEYLPGDRVQIYTAEDTLAEGYIESANFLFGNQAKSAIHLAPVDVQESGTLIVDYMFGEIVLSEKKYVLPVGYTYTIVNPYFDATWSDTRYIFRPTLVDISGTVALGEQTRVVECAPALEGRNGILTVISVDDLTQAADKVVTIV